jgi:hypothetical protein
MSSSLTQNKKRSKRNSMKFHKNRFGVGGPYEELPVMMILTISIAIFLVASSNAISLYLNHKHGVELEGAADSLSKSILNYQPILYSNTPNGLSTAPNGLYNGPAIIDLTKEQIIENFNFNNKEYDFKISIKDTSDYSEKYIISIPPNSIPPSSSDLVVRIFLVSIWAAPNEIHSARLSVMVWSKVG